ncbi:unnamed protein product, partial [Ectocarpus fasciculatus]
MDMDLDKFSTHIKRSVPSDGQVHRQVPRSARLFSAAVERSRLPRRWKARASPAFRDREGLSSSSSSSSSSSPPVDRQDVTLRRLGRVGVVE